MFSCGSESRNSCTTNLVNKILDQLSVFYRLSDYISLILLVIGLYQSYFIDYRIISVLFYWLSDYISLILLVIGFYQSYFIDYRIISVLFYWLSDYISLILLVIRLYQSYSIGYQIISVLFYWLSDYILFHQLLEYRLNPISVQPRPATIV